MDTISLTLSTGISNVNGYLNGEDLKPGTDNTLLELKQVKILLIEIIIRIIKHYLQI